MFVGDHRIAAVSHFLCYWRDKRSWLNSVSVSKKLVPRIDSLCGGISSNKSPAAAHMYRLLQLVRRRPTSEQPTTRRALQTQTRHKTGTGGLTLRGASGDGGMALSQAAEKREQQQPHQQQQPLLSWEIFSPADSV